MSGWINNAVKHKGALHKHLGVPEGEKIPAEKLRAAANSRNPTIRKEAALAETLEGFHHKKSQKIGHGVLRTLYHSKG